MVFMGKTNKWKILTFVFAILFVGMLITNIYQRQFIEYDETLALLDNENTFIDEDNSIQEGYYLGQGFQLYYDGYVDLSFTSDNPANIYLVEDNEYARYENGEDFYYIKQGLNKISYPLTDEYLETGIYYFIIEPADKDINYNIKITLK